MPPAVAGELPGLIDPVAQALVVVLTFVVIGIGVGVFNILRHTESIFARSLLGSSFRVFLIAFALFLAAQIVGLGATYGTQPALFEVLRLVLTLTFLVALIFGLLFLFQALRALETGPPEAPAPLPATVRDAEVLARIVNRVAEELERVVGSAFTYGMFRRIVRPILEDLEPGRREALAAHLSPRMTEPASSPAPADETEAPEGG